MKTPITKVGCLCLYEDKFLLIQHHDNNLYPHKWGIPFGAPSAKIESTNDRDSSYLEFVKRKLFEELRINDSLYSISLAENFTIEEDDDRYTYRLYTVRLQSQQAFPLDPLYYIDQEWINSDLIYKYELTPDIDCDKIKNAISKIAKDGDKNSVHWHRAIFKENYRIIKQESDSELNRIFGRSNSAEYILPQINADYIVSFGPPGAGKSTALEIIRKISNHRGKIISDTKKILTEGELLNIFLKNARNSTSELKQSEFYFLFQHEILVEKLRQVKDVNSFSLIDESILSTLAYTLALKELNLLNESQYSSFIQLFKIIFNNFPKPRKIIYLHCNTDTLYRRVQTRAKLAQKDYSREVELGYDLPYLEALNKAYNRIYEYLKKTNQWSIIDIDNNEDGLAKMTARLVKEFSRDKG